MRTTFWIGLMLGVTTGFGQKFVADDPLEREPRPRNAEKLANRKLSDIYDLFSLQFKDLGERQPKKGKGAPIRAKGVNTLGEPLSRSWWDKRHYYKRMSLEELRRGPGDQSAPDMTARWTVVSAKSEGVTPGFVVLDSKKRRYFVKFDPLSNPEMATSADSISARLAYALGYHVPENYIVYFSEEQLVLGDNVELADSSGKKRKMTPRDVTEILLKVPVNKEGKYRATASLALPGKPIGPPRYFGTRADDPNDTIPHEHLREVRGLHVLCAWLGHDDSRAINNLDAVVTEDGAQFVRHFLLDFGSTLGSASQKPNSPRSGDYFFGWSKSAKQLFTLGLAPPYWEFARYPDYPSLGKIESKVFDPEKWLPEYPNPAFLNRLPDDEFWAAKQVMALTDEEIKAVVATGELSDKAAEGWLIKCLIERRDKIGRAYFAKVLPLDRFAIRGGELVFEDLSQKHGLGGSGPIQVSWSKFDNQAGTRAPVQGASGFRLPEMSSDGYWVADLVQSSKPSHKIAVFVRRKGDAMDIVGIDREW